MYTDSIGLMGINGISQNFKREFNQTHVVVGFFFNYCTFWRWIPTRPSFTVFTFPPRLISFQNWKPRSRQKRSFIANILIVTSCLSALIQQLYANARIKIVIFFLLWTGTDATGLNQCLFLQMVPIRCNM